MINVNPIKGIHDIRSLRVVKKSCIPGKRQTSFLELYMLDREKDRLRNEEKRIILRLETLNNRLKDVQAFFDEKLGQVQKPKQKKNKRNNNDDKKKGWKTMSMDY